MTRAEIEARVHADYTAVLGTLIERRNVQGYREGDSEEFYCDPPAKLRVVATSDDDLDHWVDEHGGDWCDPYWNVEMAEPHPALEGARSLWVFGTSYQEGTGVVESSR